MKRFGWITALCLLLLSGCSGAAKSDADLAAPAIAKEKDLRIAVATDTHYLASELTDGGAAFKKYVANGDGKALAESDAIVDAFLDGVRAEKADMLILSGDLTNNGERKSHEKLAKKLEQLEKTGTNVYVIPGNHDINNPWARSFRGEEQLKTDSITPDDFRSIYQSFGFNEAVSKDKFSLSYLAKASQDVWLLMLDTSHYNSNYQLGAPETEGGLTSGTLDWIKECSKLAQKNGARILPVMHHNLVTHSEVLSKGYTINYADDVRRTFIESGFDLALSGHIHAQNIATQEYQSGKTLTDIATGSLAVYPHKFGVVSFQLSTKKFSYTAKELNVEQAADLPGFNERDRRNFYAIGYDKAMSEIASSDVFDQFSEQEKQALANTMAVNNQAYFTGTAPKETPGLKLWKKVSNHFLRNYVLSTAGKPKQNNNYWAEK